MIGVLAVYVVLDIQDYNWLAEEQGSKMLESLYVNTEQKLIHLLTEPERANKHYENALTRAKHYDDSDLESAEKLTLEIMKLIREDLPK